MRATLIAGTVAVFIGSSAHGQANPFTGSWSGTMPGNNNNELSVQLTLTDASGVFRMAQTGGRVARGNPCLGKEFPVEATPPSGDESTIKINGSQVLAGCIDATVALKLVQPNLLEATFKDGKLLKLTRQ